MNYFACLRAALLATGSQDATILVHSLSEEVEEPLERYTGHTGLITSIIHQHGQLISGSWDRYVYVSLLVSNLILEYSHPPATVFRCSVQYVLYIHVSFLLICVLLSSVRVWKSVSESTVIEAHKPAVWTVAGLFEFDGTRRLLSGTFHRR